jgi:predicted dithiol-disulfide oxidoreductase (DUF899 family)
MAEPTIQILPSVVERSQWCHRREELFIREKVHSRDEDALAAARRRLPMTGVDLATLVGADGPVPLVDAFEGRSMLVGYSFMWHHGSPFHEQWEGCTFAISQISDGVRALSRRPGCRDIAAYRGFMGWTMPGTHLRSRWTPVDRAAFGKIRIAPHHSIRKELP